MTTPFKVPPYLQAGDTVGVLAPASKVSYEDCAPGLRILRHEWGLHVIECQTLWSDYHQYAGTDQQRRADLQELLDNPDVKAILAARGGYGCSRILDGLDFTAFLQSPKWLVGFSDLTVLLSHIQSLGYAAIHGPMVKTMANTGGEEALHTLREALFGGTLDYTIPGHPLSRGGIASGPVTGGNLCLLAHLIGSPSAVDMGGTLLFIEDIGEYLYNIDRMMIQLKRAGQLQKLAGLIVGRFTEIRDNTEPTFGKTAYEIIAEHVQAYDFPVCFDFPVGHVPDNRTLPVGMSATLEVSESSTRLRYHADIAF